MPNLDILSHEELFTLSHPTAESLHEMARRRLDEKWSGLVAKAYLLVSPSSRETLKPFDEIKVKLEGDAQKKHELLQLMVSEREIRYPQPEKTDRAIVNLTKRVQYADNETRVSLVLFDLRDIIYDGWHELAEKGPRFNYLSPRNMDLSQVAKLRHALSVLMDKTRRYKSGHEREEGLGRIGTYMSYCEMFEDVSIMLRDIISDEDAKLNVRLALSDAFQTLSLKTNYEHAAGEIWGTLKSSFGSRRRRRLIRRKRNLIGVFLRGGKFQQAIELSREAEKVPSPMLLVELSRAIFLQNFLSKLPLYEMVCDFSLSLSPGVWSYYME